MFQQDTSSDRVGEGLTFKGSLPISRFTEQYRRCKLNFLWDIEHKFKFQPEYPLSRLLPTIGDMEEFHSLYFDHLLSLSFLERVQMFLDWLTEKEKLQHQTQRPKNASPHTITSGLLSECRTKL